MDLILWRHAEAEDRAKHSDADAARELTKRGRRQSERMAKWLEGRLEGPWRIFVSPAIRTLQTVEPLGREFDTSEDVGLGATAATVLRAVGWPDAEENVLVVGHQPTLGQVAARVLEGRDGDISIKKGAIWWFTVRSRDGSRGTVLKTVLDPDTLESQDRAGKGHR